ncbi:MAG: cyclic nucleotide-binding domain-containing protein [Leptospirales bacterium]|nr:cyclic nucleotide-binding domain-containing protein [Leptospirales bacterium]
MSLIEVAPGVNVLRHEDRTILFGCPPEVIKHLMLRGLGSPQVIVLPDTPYRFDVLQNCTEFPLYYFLFVDGNFRQGKKLTIVGTAGHLKANRRLLRLTLLGPTRKEYDALGESPWFDELYRESRALAVKDQSGRELTIDDFVHFVPFVNGIAKLPDGLQIAHSGRDRFQAGGHTIDIGFDEPQQAPYDLRDDFTVTMPARFGVTVTGGASGFIADKPCSSLVLHYNSEHMLIDCPPYLNQALNARGIAAAEIRSIFLTHIHDDHCNIFPLLRLSNKVSMITTREIFWMAIMKLSLQTLLPAEEISAMIHFVEVKAYETTEFFGVSIEPHYTVHSIPTIGATFRMHEGGASRSIVFIGDNKAFSDIEAMVEQGVVRPEKFRALKDRYTERHDILFADGGMGILHGNPRDALKSQSDRIVFMHLEKLPPEFDATFSHAVAGKRYNIIPGSQDAHIIRTMHIISASFRDISSEWSTALMNNFKIVTFNAGDIIFKQNESSKGIIYVLLSGVCSVVVHDGQRLTEKARKDAGDFVGEMAVLDQNKVRSASIVAATPVTLCALEEKLFHEFLVAEERTDEMRQLWRTRAELERFWPFSDFSDNVKDRIARNALRKRVGAGETLVKQGQSDGEFFIVLSGEYSVRHDGREIKVLRGGDMFGEYGSLDDSVRNATVSALSDGEVLEVARGEIRRIIDQAPIFNFSMRELMMRRSRELRQLDSVRRA